MKRTAYIASGLAIAATSITLGSLIGAEIGFAIAILGSIAGFETARMPTGGQ